jgi:uncharacterized protein (DUF2164 family)
MSRTHTPLLYLAAEAVLDMFLENIAANIYNSGVDDASNAVQKHLEELKAELDLSLKR